MKRQYIEEREHDPDSRSGVDLFAGQHQRPAGASDVREDETTTQEEALERVSDRS